MINFFLWTYFILSMFIKIKKALPKIKATFKMLLKMAESYLNAKKAAQEQQVVEYVPLTEAEHNALLRKLDTANSRAEMWKDKYFQVVNK